MKLSRRISLLMASSGKTSIKLQVVCTITVFFFVLTLGFLFKLAYQAPWQLSTETSYEDRINTRILYLTIKSIIRV